MTDVSGAEPGAAVLLLIGEAPPELRALSGSGVFFPGSSTHAPGELGFELEGKSLGLCFANNAGETCFSLPRALGTGGRSLFVQAFAVSKVSPGVSDGRQVAKSALVALPKLRSLERSAALHAPAADGIAASVEGSAPGTSRNLGPRSPSPDPVSAPPDLSSLLDLPGVVRWYDPELSSYSGGVLEDLTGNADLRQQNAGSRPTWSSTGINGRPSLSFDGSNDHLFNAAPLLASADQFTLLMIVKAPSGQIDKRLVAEGSSTTNVPLFVPVRTGSNTRTTSPSQLFRNDANQFLFEDSTGPLVFDDEVHLFGVIVDRAAGTVTNFEDTELDDPDAYPATGTISVDRFTLGAMIRTTTQFHFAGEVGPLAVVDRALSIAEIASVRRYYEGRGYLEPRVPDPIVSAVPPGCALVYDEDFRGYADVNELFESGQAPSTGKPFADSFVTFGVRFLAGNNDRCYKGLAGDSGAGATSLEDLIGTQPHALAGDNLLLRYGELPLMSRADFANRQHAGGMLSSERGFAHGPGLFEARLRVRNLPPGGHFALWLLTQGTNPHDLEIDLVEIVGNNLTSADKPLNALFYNGHDRQNVPTQNGPQTMESVSNFELNQWHVYSFLYTPTTFTWYRDGQIVRQEASYFDDSSPLYFLATWESNFAQAKNFPGPSQGNAPSFPGEVEIDYLRVWAPPTEEE